MSTVRHSTGSTIRPFGPPPTMTIIPTVTLLPVPMTPLPSRMVMVGNSISYEAYTHNQSLPNVTSLDMLAMRPRWFFWCFGGATLPTVTNGYHLSSCSHWFFWPYGHRLYHRLPTLTTHGIWVATISSQPLPLRSPA